MKTQRLLVHQRQGERSIGPSQIWDGHAPMVIGPQNRPEAVVEPTESGIRIRPWKSDTKPTLLAWNSFKSEQTVSVNERTSVVFEPLPEFHRASDLVNLDPSNNTKTEHQELFLLVGIGDHIYSSFKPGTFYKVSRHGAALFSLTQDATGKSIAIEVLGEGISKVAGKAKPEKLIPGQSLKMERAEVQGLTLSFESWQWKFSYLTTPKVEHKATSWRQEQSTDLMRSLSVGSLALVGLLVGSLVLKDNTPVTPNEELIPAQFAKVLLTPPKPVAKSENTFQGNQESGGSPTGPSEGVKQAAQTQVAKAFRSKALQGAVQSLMGGGLSQIIASNSALMNVGTTEDVLRSASRAVGQSANSGEALAAIPSDRNVSGVGGGTGIGGSGTGTGYGSGAKAGIQGQGTGMVALDWPGGQVEEGLSKDEVGKVIHAHLAEVRYCYESSMLKNPNIEGKLMLDFTIGGDGGVKSANVKESSLGDPRLDDCILRRLVRWKFPNPKGGVQVAVSYPFVFKALTR